MIRLLFTLFSVALMSTSVLAAGTGKDKAKKPKKPKLENGIYAQFKTTKGLIIIKLEHEKAPMTVANFIGLAEGKFNADTSEYSEKFYDGLKFHRVLPDFVIQGGCPNSKDGAEGMPGTGGPGYAIDCELDGVNQHHERGVLSMAHSGRNTGGSQFFVCHSRTNTAHLDGNHTCFGKVVEGLDVIDEISEGDSIDSITVL